MNDDLYPEGGWHLGPVEEVELPRVTLTKKQLAENAAAEKAHDKLVKQIEALAKKAEKLGAWIGGDDYEDGGIGYPPLELPHDPEALDTTKFGPKEWAFYEWEQKGTKDALIKLKGFGVKLRYYPAMLMSVGHLPPPGPPKLPDWAK